MRNSLCNKKLDWHPARSLLNYSRFPGSLLTSFLQRIGQVPTGKNLDAPH